MVYMYSILHVVLLNVYAFYIHVFRVCNKYIKLILSNHRVYSLYPLSISLPLTAVIRHRNIPTKNI